MTIARHQIRRHADEAGHVASCSCGWRTCRPDRDRRDHDAIVHARRGLTGRVGTSPRGEHDYLAGMPFPFEPADYTEDHR